MYLRVLPPDGEVRLTAPLRASEAELARFVAKHAAWAKKKQQEIQARAPAEAQQYLSGERHFLWGKPYELCVRPAERNAVFLKGSRIILGLAEMGTPEQREQIPDLAKKVIAGVRTWCFVGLSMAMNQLNARPKIENNT